jgi:hypothetical protein
MLEGEVKTQTEQENDSILTSCQPILEGIFRDYYNRSGKQGYKFILSE